ncbi:MAG: aspartyl-tRNA(Asn)/glutamyl-tRNA (Gln) amidotransferase subunit C [Parcubacteria group bacterium Gr01-1014_2]|nr:MAG: aspartyl-tRNA(Asn)/glutamyl-tRNA (Gln) amidotransferase subunit C [Parcubacteria group bacterium Gr01-1014_2]
MAISKKDIDHIAELARLGLSEKEKKKYAKELSGILDYMDKLNEINTERVQPTAQVTGLKNVFRKDEDAHKLDADKIKKIIGQAPQREDNFVKTKPILENKWI